MRYIPFRADATLSGGWAERYRPDMLRLSVLILAAVIGGSVQAKPSRSHDTRNAIAFGWLARECDIVLRDSRRVWLDGLATRAGEEAGRDAGAFAYDTYQAVVAKYGRERSCERFRAQLSGLGWL